MIEILELFEAVGRGVAAVVEGVATLSDIAGALTSSKAEQEQQPDIPADPGMPPDEAAAPAGANRAAEAPPAR